jgi:hypothetical protein
VDSKPKISISVGSEGKDTGGVKQKVNDHKTRTLATTQERMGHINEDGTHHKFVGEGVTYERRVFHHGKAN